MAGGGEGHDEGHGGGLSRRKALKIAGLAGLGGALGLRALISGPGGGSDRLAPESSGAGRPAGSGLRPWSDPDTWGGEVPGPRDVAVVAGPVHLDTDALVAGVVVEPGASLVFDSSGSRTLESAGNVVVRGRLEAHPESAAVVHTVRFTGIDETRFEGGGDRVLESDVGLWVVDDGELDTAGTPKRAWTRARGAVDVGATTFQVQDDPTGWQVGDEIALTPTASPLTPQNHQSYDHSTIAAVDGRTLTLSTPTAFAHPEVEVGPGAAFTAEVLNLGRNVVIEGTPGGRAHVFVSSTKPQVLRHSLLRHLGPRQTDGKTDAFVPGRYGIHFHLAGEGSRGTLVEGTVGRQCGSHVFVTHSSHGVTWRDCITHDTAEIPFWWDLSTDDDPSASNDVVYEGCVASLFRPAPGGDRRLSGFQLGAGDGNIARRSVAVGGQGGGEGAGFMWPAQSKGVWQFEDCVAHNMRKQGIFVWQNSHDDHVVRRFALYHNGGFGIDHGSYLNRYQYEDGVLFGNLAGALNVKALSQTKAGALRFTGLSCDNAGTADFAVVVPNHTLPSETPVEFLRCSFRGYRHSAFQFLGGGSDNPHLFDVVDSTYEGNEFWLEPGVPGGSVIRVQDEVRGTLELRRWDRPGEERPAWNASVSAVPAFAPAS